MLRRLVIGAILSALLNVVTFAQIAPPGGAIIAGVTPIIGTCTTGYFLYNNSGKAGCSVSSGTVTSVSTTCPTSSNSPVSGVVTLAGGVIPVTRSASTDTLASGDCSHEILYNYAGSVASSLPSASSLGANWFVQISAATGTSVTVTSSGGNFSNTGTTTLTIAAGGAAAIVSDGTNFSVNASGSGSSATFHPGYVSGGRWYPTWGILDSNGAAGTANRVVCDPAIIQKAVTIKALGVYVTTLDSGGNISAAIFTASGGQPATLVDYTAVGSETTAVALTLSLHNTTDTLSAGAYFFCASQDNSVAALLSHSITDLSIAYMLGSASINAALGATQNQQGIYCTAGTNCGTGYAVWSAGAFTWASFSGATWTDLSGSSSATAPNVIMETN